MLVVKTILKESPGKGIGLFAAEQLSKGQIWSEEHPDFDIHLARSLVDQMKNNVYRDFIHIYGEYNETSELFKISIDNGRFINHSDTPNTMYIRQHGYSITTKDIDAGEELTIDYNTICDDFKKKGFYTGD